MCVWGAGGVSLSMLFPRGPLFSADPPTLLEPAQLPPGSQGSHAAGSGWAVEGVVRPHQPHQNLSVRPEAPREGTGLDHGAHAEEGAGGRPGKPEGGGRARPLLGEDRNCAVVPRSQTVLSWGMGGASPLAR